MTQADTTTLSVRGEAETVRPDFVQLHPRIRTVGATEAEAVTVCAQAQRAVLGEFERLGGAALDLAGERRALGWVAHSVSTWDEREYRDKVGDVATGWVVAEMSLLVTARDFALMDLIGQPFADQQELHPGIRRVVRRQRQSGLAAGARRCDQRGASPSNRDDHARMHAIACIRA